MAARAHQTFCYFALLLYTDRDNMKYSEKLGNKQLHMLML